MDLRLERGIRAVWCVGTLGKQGVFLCNTISLYFLFQHLHWETPDHTFSQHLLNHGVQNLDPTWPVKVLLSHLVHLTWDHFKHDPDFTLFPSISRFLLTLEFSIVLELCWGVWLSTFFPSLPFPCLLACKTRQSCWMEFTTVSMLQGLLSMQNATSKFNFISDAVASLVQPDFNCSCAWSKCWLHGGDRTVSLEGN